MSNSTDLFEIDRIVKQAEYQAQRITHARAAIRRRRSISTAYLALMFTRLLTTEILVALWVFLVYVGKQDIVFAVVTWALFAMLSYPFGVRK